MIRKTLLLLLLMLSHVTPLEATSFDVMQLHTEYAVQSMGTEIERPGFSWKMESNERGEYQQGYHFVVTDEHGEKIWDSGKVTSSKSLNIYYDEESLKASTRYYWSVTVWNEKRRQQVTHSWFETGFVGSDISVWSGTKWLGVSSEDLVFYAHCFPVFKAEYKVQLDKASPSTKEGFFYGANDTRLSNRYKNTYQLAAAKDSSYVMLQLDIAPLAERQEATFSEIKINNLRAPSNLLAAHEGGEFSVGETGLFKSYDLSKPSIPMTRTTFEVKKEIDKARLYATARGIYEFHLNGRPISENYFTPGMTQYNKTQRYQTFGMYNHSLGIERHEESPGFQHFWLKPEIDVTGQMKWAKGYYDVMYGRITRSREVTGDIYLYHCKIPSDTTTTIMLPEERSTAILYGQKLLEREKGVKHLGSQNSKHHFAISTGVYELTFPIQQ